MSTAQALPTVFSGSNTGWEGSLYAFLAEKQRRSGSNRTPDSYYRTLRHFFGSLQKSPDQVSPKDVFSFAHGVGLSGREPSPVTVGARLSCISSFFKFLISTRPPQGQSLRSRSSAPNPVPAHQAASPLSQCSSLCLKSSLTPSRADATSPSSSLSSSPADAGRRSSTSQPAISPLTTPPFSTAISVRAACAAAGNYPVLL